MGGFTNIINIINIFRVLGYVNQFRNVAFNISRVSARKIASPLTFPGFRENIFHFWPKTWELLKVTPFLGAQTREMLKVMRSNWVRCPETWEMLKVTPFFIENAGNVKGDVPEFKNIAQNAGTVDNGTNVNKKFPNDCWRECSQKDS